MPSATWIRAVIGLVAGAMLGLSALTGDSIDENGLRWLGGVAGGITLVLLAFDRWIWKWPVVRKLTELAGSRVIHGTWRGTLNYERDADGHPGHQPVFMALHQTYSSVRVRCYFPTTGSESASLVAAIEQDSHRHVLRYIYRSEVPAPERDRNRPTEGTVELRLVGRPVEEISGSYYAERNAARGTISFDGYCKKVAGSGGQATRLPYKDLPSTTAGR